MKKVLVVSDTHCGHLVGLTPPAWQIGSESNLTKRQKYGRIQEEAWEWFSDQVQKHGPYDVIIANGDMIDGSGVRSGGTELITVDREEQAEMAIAVLKRCIGKRFTVLPKIIMTYGTAYHTGDGEDWENYIANKLDAKIGAHEWVQVDGVIFDVKHHIGGSQVPHTRANAIGRDALWSQLWADRCMVPDSDILIRSHVHYHVGSWDFTIKPHWRMTTPALQAMGTKYGARRCSGLVDFGFLVFEVEGTHFDFTPVTVDLKSCKARVTKV